MESLAIYDQPHAEWLGEFYVSITPENMKEMVMRINDHPDNPEHELSDWDAQRLCDKPWMLFQWLDEGLAAFKPFEKCTVYIGDRIRSYDIEDIDIGAHRVPLKDVPEGEECFVVHLTNWLTKESD
jgi:hypothetical protein